MSSFEFKGKTILVTGAGAGIGKAIVKKLSSGGAQVIALSLVQDELDALEREIPNVKTIQVDLTNWDGVEAALQDVGPLDGLVNNAGTATVAHFLEITKEQLDKVFELNVNALVHVGQLAAKNMIRNKIQGGSIVNVSSVAALSTFDNATVYCASKAAVQSITKSMARELGRLGIRVNSVNPTMVKTELSRPIWENSDGTKDWVSRTPLGRFAEAEEVADAVAFLLSDRASMVNGIPLPVDGGILA